LKKYGKITLPIDVIKKIDQICEKYNKSRTEIIRCVVGGIVAAENDP
jgi:metal-responsive CopG/Arc/MetJ family transcriptional regulator